MCTSSSLSPCAIKLIVSLMQKELSSLMGLELISLLIPEEEHSKGRNVVAFMPLGYLHVCTCMLQCTTSSEGASVRTGQFGTSKRCRERSNTVPTATERGRLHL